MATPEQFVQVKNSKTLTFLFRLKTIPRAVVVIEYVASIKRNKHALILINEFCLLSHHNVTNNKGKWNFHTHQINLHIKYLPSFSIAEAFLFSTKVCLLLFAGVFIIKILPTHELISRKSQSLPLYIDANIWYPWNWHIIVVAEFILIIKSVLEKVWRACSLTHFSWLTSIICQNILIEVCGENDSVLLILDQILIGKKRALNDEWN